jgi:hypothetical protein
MKIGNWFRSILSSLEDELIETIYADPDDDSFHPETYREDFRKKATFVGKIVYSFLITHIAYRLYYFNE